MNPFIRSQCLRSVVATCVLFGLPLAALADVAQRMAVFGNQSVEVGAESDGVRVKAFCIDVRRKEPDSGVMLPHYTGEVSVSYRNEQGDWVRYGSLDKAQKDGVLTVTGMDGVNPFNGRLMGRADSIGIRPGPLANGRTYRVSFESNALFGVDAKDVAAGRNAVRVLEELNRYAVDNRLPSQIVQHTYWSLQREGRASIGEALQMTKLGREEFLAELEGMLLKQMRFAP